MPNPKRGAEQVAEDNNPEMAFAAGMESQANINKPLIDRLISENKQLRQKADDIDEAVGEYRQVLDWLVADIRNTAKEQKIKGAELYQNPCYGIGLHAWKKATELLGLAALNPEKEEKPSGHK